ncbi:microtubule-associated tumor suppressor 1 homolog A isoform X2 [Micropterus salmoides]|uniref:microtubule-associated tumor suppressor 1 homolog A isoform X2 n=1 Tax=Micropterus salmoides TaxID=27706 RepID=UPI0018EA75A5|nr:microtubule-associated tumor suppressor 1 homolog A isoform X2 [Micropterus salmoides]
MSADHVERTVALPHRDLQLGRSPESHYSNMSPSPSLDSNSSLSNLSDREAYSSPYINTMEGCLCDSTPVDNPYNNTLPHVFCGVSMNLNQTFIATPVNASVNFWNENLSLISNHETGSEYLTFSKNTEDVRNSAVRSPDSAGRESQLSSCEISSRGSTENGRCSVNSGEMVIRSNSFCLEDQALLVVSSLEESSISLDVGQRALPASESALLSTSLPDVCEKSTDRVTEESIGHPCLGMTFIQAELTTEEYDMATSNSFVALPSENEGRLLMTFVCEASPESGKGPEFASAEREPHFPGERTPEEGKTCVSTRLAMQDREKDFQTSTPLQNIGNKIPSLPSFSESPCTGNAGSPGLQSVKLQQVSVTPKHLVAGQLPLASKVKKMEIKKFPKSDFSSVKSKVVTRSTVPSPASQVNVNNRHTDAHRGAAIRMSPAKVKCSTTVISTTTQIVSDTQRQVNTGATNLGVTMIRSPGHTAVDGQSTTRTTPPYHHPAASIHAASGQVADDAAQHAGNQTFCFSSSEKSPDRSCQTDPKPTPKKGVSNKIEVRSGSALGQAKPSVLTMRPRCSSESLPLSPRAHNEKRTTLRTSTSFTIPKADTSLGHNKPGNLNCSSQNQRGTNGPAENSTREVKRISLVADSSKLTTAGASWDENKSRFRVRPSPRQARGTPISQPPAASPKPATLSTRQRQGTLGRDEFRTFKAVGTPQSKQKSSTVSGGAAHKPAPFKSVVLKARLITTPGKNTGLPLATACKPAASTSKGASSSTLSPLTRATSARLVRLTQSGHVDKNKPKASSRQQHPKQQACQQNQSNGPPDVVPARVTEGGTKDQSIQQLRGLLAASNCRFEAVAIVLQQTLAERDEATRQRRELSQELVDLRGKLVCSVHSSELLEKEKDELRVALEEALQKLQEQHQKDLTELEQRLQAFYQAEWDKVHLTYQEEADKCKTLMQKQMGELEANHEAIKLELESKHAEQLQCVKQQYEMSLEELRQVHNQERQALDKTLKDAEAALSGQIEELTVENNALIEKLTAEENRRKELAEKSQKDSHTLYLEQELESLKVVLDIKNKQLHQQEKKLMEIDKLKEKNVKLDESLQKVQQENEDLKARMDRHAALSRQLSTEQAVLQESLHKESKVNKRLSMENEELLWKLHNGDLSSPRKVSPTSTSPSHSFSFQSPRSSGLFSSSPVSPR